jgi:mRNA interferase RelE/StbE
VNLAWKIEVEAPARKQFRKIGYAPAARIVAGLKKIADLPDPRTRGKAMVDDWIGYWRFRFDDFRVIARIEDDRLVILVIAVGHRREVYD